MYKYSQFCKYMTLYNIIHDYILLHNIFFIMSQQTIYIKELKYFYVICKPQQHFTLTQHYDRQI